MDVLFQDDVRWPGRSFAGAVFWSAVMMVGGTAAGVWAPWIVLAVAGWICAAVGFAFALVAVNLRVLRVAVTLDALSFSFGLLRKDVPIGEITVMGARHYDHEHAWSRVWGVIPVMEGPDQYVAWGGSGDAVAVVATDARGRTRRYLVSTHHASRLLGNLVKAQQALPVERSPLHVLNN